MTLELLDAPARNAAVEASLLFVDPSVRRPRLDFSEAGTGVVIDPYTTQQVRIRDARGTSASLDVEGFALVRRPSSIDFLHESDILSTGDAEAAALVRDVTGAARVLVFDHTVRRRAPDAPRQPSIRAHVDYTEQSGPQRVRDLLGDDAKGLLKHRVAFINVWRSIRHAAQDWPLAVADARSIAANDLVETDIVYADRAGEIYGLRHSARHRWFYYPDMALDEALLIKCYDLERDVARFAPHTAFESPLTPPGAPPRESIEFRTIAFFD